jgi:hypothetical protein
LSPGRSLRWFRTFAGIVVWPFLVSVDVAIISLPSNGFLTSGKASAKWVHGIGPTFYRFSARSLAARLARSGSPDQVQA